MKNIDRNFPLIIAGIVIILFIFLQPKLSATLFPFKRQMVWKEFVTSVETSNHVDGRLFWQFREFYYPGYFTFERMGFDQKTSLNAQKSLSVELLPESSPSAFLIYKSGKLNSLEALVNNDDLTKTVADASSKGANYLVNTPQNVVYTIGNKARILFIKPASEMVKANGYYDVKDRFDSKYIEGKYWLSVTEVTLE